MGLIGLTLISVSMKYGIDYQHLDSSRILIMVGRLNLIYSYKCDIGNTKSPLEGSPLGSCTHNGVNSSSDGAHQQTAAAARHQHCHGMVVVRGVTVSLVVGVGVWVVCGGGWWCVGGSRVW